MGIDLNVNYVRQSSDGTCWAAAAAMMIGRSEDGSVVQQMDEREPDRSWKNGISARELDLVADVFGWSQVYPVCFSADDWERALNEHGPLIIQIPNTNLRTIVVVGVAPNSQEPSASHIHVLDPSDSDMWLELDDFQSRYNLGGGSWNDCVYKR
jgi:Papain-like cysteine protease AvrRpt2